MVQQSGPDVQALPGIDEDDAKKWIHIHISFIQTEYELHQLLLPAEAEQHSVSRKKVMEEIDQIRVVVEKYLKSIQPKKTTASVSVASSARSIKCGLKLLYVE